MTRLFPSRALRSTALCGSLVLLVGLSALAPHAWAATKVPLPKPRPIARGAAPKTTASIAPTAKPVHRDETTPAPTIQPA
ncbi:MAG TPA: lytic transglycosylase domain-containing protein, partial [Tardiphaga sp.]